MSDNIKVVVKVRPLISREVDQKLPYAWRVQNNTLYQLDNHGRDVGTSFTFDKVYDKSTKTLEVYNDVAKPIVEAAIAGFNGTIFAYGQTSSGKTYTMSGTDESLGIIPLAVLNLYDMIKKIPDRDFLVRVSYIEIYNETLKDLLDIENKHVKICDTFQGVKVKTTEKVTCTPQEVLEVMKMGEANRQTGATNMNEESSRSHSIFQITIESREHIEDENETGCVNVSTLNLVDLAGSERSGQTGATGVRFKEGTHINKSLSSLALVIKQLSEDPNKFANYRDSKLTRILQNSLGGNAKTSIICAITPASIEETVSTLQFANRAKAIKNKPEVNAVATDATMIQSLTKQLSKLQSELANKKNVEQDNANLQKQIENLHKMILNGFGQRSIMTSSKQKFQQRRKTISTLHPVEEDPDPIVPKFRTPSLKYNPMVFSTDFQPIQNSTKLTAVPEEVRLITPPPIDKKVSFQNEIIDLDSDDEAKSNLPDCSPIHSCYVSSKTPPCILRKNAKAAEKNLKDLEELTEREKIYAPQVVELLEKLEHKGSIISKLKDTIETLNQENKEKDDLLLSLKEKAIEVEQEVMSIDSAKSLLEAQCKEHRLKLIDLEVSYETLKKKSKTREKELLSLLDEKMRAKQASGDSGVPQEKPQELFNALETPPDISALKTLLKDYGIAETVDGNISVQIQDLVRNSQTELNAKNKAVIELEENILAQKEKIESLEHSSQQLQTMVDCFKSKLDIVEGENDVLKSKVENLNATVENQKKLLEIANGDIKKYNSLISDLRVKLSKTEVPDVKLNDSMLETLIANEENFIANNENMRNIIQSFKIIIDMKTREINETKKSLQDSSDLSNNNKVLIEQIENKEQQINTLLEQVENLKDQLNSNIETINSFMQRDQDNTDKLNNIEIQNESLHNLNEQYANQIKDLQTLNEHILSSMSEKVSNYQDSLVKIENLSGQIDELSHKVADYEKEIEGQKVLLESFKSKEIKMQESCTEANAYLNKVKDLTLMLNSTDFVIPETIDTNDSFLKYLGNSLCNLEVATKTIIQDKQQLDINIKSLEDELSAVKTNNKTLSQQQTEFIQRNEKLSQQVTQLSNELIFLRNELEVKIRIILEKEIKLNEAGENNRRLHDDLLSKENNISSLQEKVASMHLEIQKLLTDKDNEILFTKEIEELKNTLRIKEESYAESLKSKENEIAEALTNSFKERSKLLTATKELNNAVENRNLLLGIIMDKTTKIKSNYDINDSISYISDYGDDYEHIVYTLDKIANYLETVTSINTDDKHAKDLLLEAQTQISELSRRNLELMNECSKIELKNQDLLHELNLVKVINTDLSEAGTLLDHLKVELNTKSEELDTMENKIRDISSKVTEQECLMMVEKVEIEKDKQRVIKLQFLDQSTFVQQPDYDKTLHEKKMALDEIQISGPKYPKSLKTITLNKVIECLLTNNAESSSVTTSNSSSNFANTQTTVCECISLSLELSKANKKILALNNILKQLQEINNNLQQDQETVRREIQMLVEPANELQKKIINHRTNLSTLTATTYAENKLLHSQLRVLKHHHSRYIHLCQRDLPGFKSQLNELMAILRNSSITDKHNNSFKRYSLPDILDSNTTVSTLKNDSTFDGDLLMLDTNITMTTTGDNTLMGPDQTCLDVTQSNFDNEETCNTNDVSKVLDTRLVFSQIVDSVDDNQKNYQKIVRLEVENQRLREELTSCKSSSKSVDEKSNRSGECEKCKNFEQLITEIEKLQENIKIISEELALTQSLKKEMEIKYNNLMLELPSSGALVKKLNTLEKEYNIKSQDITKLSSDLNKKTQTVKVLREENETLSDEIMEKVSENEDLTKELNLLKETLNNLYQELELAKTTGVGNKVKECSHQCTNELDALYENNVKLSQELDEPVKENEIIKQANNSKCSQCAVKDELIVSLQNTGSNSKSNRSLSDSRNTSSFYKICTLQNELHASKEACKKITEEVTTMKNQLDRSNTSLVQSMDLDESMGDGNIFSFTKDFGTIESHLPHMAAESPLDIYTLDKTECFNYFAERTGAEKENLNYDMKIIDVMKMLYNNILIKHANEVENLVNRLKDFEESKIMLQSQIQNLISENTKITNKLEEKDTNKIREDKNIRMMSQIKENINVISLAVSTPTENKNTDEVSMFKEHLLEVIDRQFGMSSAKVFDSLVSKILTKNQHDLNEIIDKYSQLQCEMESILEELKAVTSNVNELKSQLSHKESEYSLLKAQKEKVHEICNAVTLDIIQKDQDLSSTIANVCKKLYDMNLIKQNDIDVNLSLSNTVNNLFECLMEQINSKNTFIEEKKNQILEIKQFKTLLEHKDQELEQLRANIVTKENKLQTQKTLREDLNRIYESKLEENKANLQLIEKLSEEISVLKTVVTTKDNEITALQRAKSSVDENLKGFEQTIQGLKQENDKLKTAMNAEMDSQKQTEITNLLQKVEQLTEEREKLATLIEIIVKEKEACHAELDKCNDILKLNKIEMENMKSDIIVLKESVKDNVSVIDGLKGEAKSLLDLNTQIKGELDTKMKECSRLEMNIKTHEKTAEIQSKMIMRLQKQKEDEEKQKDLKNKQLEEITQKFEALQKEYEAMEASLKTSKEEIDELKTLKETLETRITELEADVERPKSRTSIEAIAENSRRRRRSLHDSKRLFAEDHCQDSSKMEAVFESRAMPDDLFMDVDDHGSNRSSPNRHSRGRDSLLARSDHTDEETPSRPSSVLATRRRRQSIHDLHRSTFQHESNDNPLTKLTEDLTDLRSDSSKHNESEVNQLKQQLASCQQELEELKESYRELDEECETCAQYLREREELCLQLKKENQVLLNQLKETTETMKSADRSQTESRPSFAHASVNTDEDWANLHSVVVDRMSFNAEVEKNKRLTKTIEELRYKKQELKNTIAKMHRALEKHSSTKDNRELEITRSELAACKEELAEVKERCRELDEECETCAEYLRERDGQCRKLREAKAELELKLQQHQEDSPGGALSGRKKRQSIHDQNRAADMTHEATDTSDDLLSYKVERDNSQSAPPGSLAQEIQFLKAALDRVRKEKAALEQLAAAQAAMPLMPPTMYVATGSGIVQNQQLTDVMKENHKLKKINAKLVSICKKRGKVEHESNIENEDPEQG